MFGTIRKHQTWLWAIIITLTIISFVIFFSPYTKLDSSVGRKGNYGSIDGHPISEEQFGQAWREVQLRYFFMSGGRWPEDDARRMGFEPERETYQWLLILQKLQDAGIHVASDMAARTGRQMLDQFQRGGSVSPEAFVTRVLQPRGLSISDFERYVKHSLGVQELISVVGLSGKLVTPQEARVLYIREHQELSSSALFFSASNFLGAVTVSPQALTQFYTNRLAEYRIPERMQVTYVKFATSNYLSQAETELSKTNLNELVDMNFQRMGTNYLRLASTPEQAKAKIREEMIRMTALTEARRKASEFATELFDKEPLRPDNLETLAKAKGLTPLVTQPFDRREGPRELEVSAAFATAAFSLNPTNEPFAPPLPGEDGVYVIAYKQRMPSEAPSFEQVKDKVTSDFRYLEAISIARRAGTDAYTTVSNRLAQGKSFADACAEAKVTPVALPPFSIATRAVPVAEDHIALNELKQLAFSTSPGKLSSFQMTRDGCMALFVAAKIPLDEAKIASDLPNFLAAVRSQRQNEAFNDWFRKQAERGLRDTPLAQPKAPPTMGSGAASSKS